MNNKLKYTGGKETIYQRQIKNPFGTYKVFTRIHIKHNLKRFIQTSHKTDLVFPKSNETSQKHIFK
jgi:hypothetical protein